MTHGHGSVHANRREILAAARRAVEADPEDPWNYVELAEAASGLVRFREARRAAEHARRLAPDEPAPHVTLSAIAIRTMRWRAAEEHARDALAIDPENTAAHNNLGVALSQLGRKHEAVSALGTASTLDPRDTRAHDNARRVAAGWMAGTILSVAIGRAAILPLVDRFPLLLVPVVLAVAVMLVVGIAQMRGRKRHAYPKASIAQVRELRRQNRRTTREPSSSMPIAVGAFLAVAAVQLFLMFRGIEAAPGRAWMTNIPLVLGLLSAACFSLAYHRRRR